MKVITIILLTLFIFFSFQEKGDNIIRMNKTSFSSKVVKTDTLSLVLNDTIPNKIIKIYSDKNGFPIKYSRDIFTGVCIDGECRLVAITLFWNTTGRYLGFKLPNNEYLSKTEHDPFSAFEYDRLHELLSDFNSPLANYTIDELVPNAHSNIEEIDAISSATIAAVLDHIVEGAVYTTYTLWHIAYGPTKHEIERLTSNQLNAEFCLLILNSNIIKDQIWVLNHISDKMEISAQLQDKLLELISGNDIYLAERAINALKPAAINDEIQLKMAKIFQSSGFLQKRLIIQKLKETKQLNDEVSQILTSELKDLNGTLIKNILEMYSVHQVNDTNTILEVAKLLKHENRYVSNQAVAYLEQLENLDKKTRKTLEKTKRHNS